MGTRLISQGLELERDDPCLWNLSHPDAVREIHSNDITSGAEGVLTNTFGANRVWLGRFGREDEVGKINRTAVLLAREAAGPARFVLGSVGPTASEQPDAYREQAGFLVEAGADALVLETHRADQAFVALRALRHDVPVPLLVSLYVWPDSPEESLRRLEESGADALGANCEVGMERAVGTADALRSRTSLPLYVKPSRDPALTLADDIAAFARAVPSLLRSGPVLIGGCCGTTEAHVAALCRSWYYVPHTPRPIFGDTADDLDARGTTNERRNP